MKTEEYLALNYTYIIKKNNDGSFFGTIKELPGCMTEGDDFSDVYNMLNDAKRAWIEAAIDLGREVPLPQSEASFSGKILVRMSKPLHARLADISEECGVSLNTTIISLLEEKSGIVLESRRNYREAMELLGRVFQQLQPASTHRTGLSGSFQPIRQPFIAWKPGSSEITVGATLCH